MRARHAPLRGGALAALLVPVILVAPLAISASATPPQDQAATGVSHRNVPVCAKPVAGAAGCHAIRRDTIDSSGKPVPAATGAISGYTPADIQDAYKLGAVSTPPGATVAIVDAYDDPNAEKDLATYRQQFGLPPLNVTAGPTFRKLNQTGGTTPPKANGGWAQEISLDLDMVSAACPGCNILLIEANSASFADLGTAVDTAVRLGAVAVSNSYGGSDTAQPSTGSPYNHPGVAITASTGDNGYGMESPASFPTVVAVGGTSLHGSKASGWSESAWSGAGSGCSTLNAKPTWQTSVTACPGKANADVSAVADPNTGVAVYDSYRYQGVSGWLVFGGTSASSPIIASVYALSGNTTGYPASYTWSHTSQLHDVTSGSNGTCSTPVWCTAGTGWDGPTGLGTPNGTSAF